MKKKSIDIICVYCGNINKVNYLGNEKPKKVRFQCRKCGEGIKYEDKIGENFRW